MLIEKTMCWSMLAFAAGLTLLVLHAVLTS
jgi:hypothetical protein